LAVEGQPQAVVVEDLDAGVEARHRSSAVSRGLDRSRTHYDPAMRQTWRRLALLAVILTTATLSAAAAVHGTRAAGSPPLVAVPRATCGPGSHPETGIQGRVSSADYADGQAVLGFNCNTELVGSYTVASGMGTYGGFKVERY